MPKHAAPRSCVSLEGIRFLGFSVESASKLLSEDEFVTNTNGDYRESLANTDIYVSCWAYSSLGC